MTAPAGPDLVLCGIDAGTGQVGFGPRLSYALAVAELAELEAAERIAARAEGLVLLDPTPTGEPYADAALSALKEKWPPPASPLTVLWWAQWRGPRRIDPYLAAAGAAGVVDVTDGVLSVVDPGPVRTAAERLIAVLGNPAPTDRDVAFAVLADAGRVARLHLHGWEHHQHRARLHRLRQQAARGDAGRLLREGGEAVATLSHRAESDSRTFDHNLGRSGGASAGTAVWLSDH